MEVSENTKRDDAEALMDEYLADVDRRAREAMARAAQATPGQWKLRLMDVYADQDGTSNVDTAVRVASTYYCDKNGRPRTNDATFIANAHKDVPALGATAVALAAEVRRLRERDVAWQRATGCDSPVEVLTLDRWGDE